MSISNITINQGTDYSLTVTIADDNGDPLDLTGYTLAAQIRKTYTSSTSTPFTVTTGAAGVITLSLSNETSAGLPAGQYVYDLVTTDTADINVRVIEGGVTVSPGVTR
jgi:hypothetical protein